MSEIPEVEYQVHCVISNLPVSALKIQEFKHETLMDVLHQVMKFVRNGWPNTLHECPPEVKPYYHIKEELSIANGLLLRVDRIVIPATMRSDMLKRIHEGHLGVER
jgi:hypothetical protein